MTNKQDANLDSSKEYNCIPMSESGSLQNGEEKEKAVRVDFDQAITACGYGKFQYLLMLAMVPACSAQVYSSLTMAYVLPIAECDLKLTNNDKGALNAAVYIGMTLGSIFGGFASDVFGRRKLIIYGNAVAFVCNLSASLAPSFWLLLLMKVGSGFSMTGPIAALISYCAETHNNEKRPRIIMINGALSTFAQGTQPVLAFYLIPMNFRIELIPGILDFTSWRLFLLVSSLPNLMAAFSFTLFPESPKFLLTKGCLEKAVDSLKYIYVVNTGKPAHTYPVYELDYPVKSVTKSPSVGLLKSITNGVKQVSPIFRPPYLNTAMVVFCISACTMIAMNTVRLWVPQLFATLHEAKQHNITGVTTVCEMIGGAVKAARPVYKLVDEGRVCNTVNGEVYLRTFVISGTAALSFLISTPLIGWIGKKNLAKLCFPLAAAVAISINWATSENMFTGLLAVYSALNRNAFIVMSTIIVDLFPTAFRSLAVSMVSLCGRLASTLGNLLFPMLLNLGCSVAFFSIGGILLLASALVWLVSNKTEKL